MALETVAGGALAFLVSSPYLYEALVRSKPSAAPETIVTDLANIVIPTPVTLLRYARDTAARLPGGVAEQGAYFGSP